MQKSPDISAEVKATCCSACGLPGAPGAPHTLECPPPAGIRGFPGLPSFPTFQHLCVWRPKAGSDLGTDLGAKASCLHPHTGLLGVDQGNFLPPIGGGCHVLPPGEGAGSPPAGRGPPLAPSKTDQKETFAGSPGPPAALAPTPTGPLPIPTACWWRGRGRAALSVPSGSSLFLRGWDGGGGARVGDRRVPFRSPQPPSQPPGPRLSAAARAAYSPRRRREPRTARHLEFCPIKGGPGGRTRGEEGRRPAARNAIRSPKQHGQRRGPEQPRRRRPRGSARRQGGHGRAEGARAPCFN